MPLDELSIIHTALGRISDKLDKHDEKFDMIAQTLQQLVKIDTELRDLKESHYKTETKVNTLDKQQHEHSTLLREIQTERKHNIANFETRSESVECKLDTLAKRLEALEQKPIKLIDKALFALFGAIGSGIGLYIISLMKGK